MYKLLESDGGHFNTHTDMLSLDEAILMRDRHRDYFPNSEWQIEQYEHEEKEERHYNEKACDGWEDIYPIN
jgi:hypothetical protein